jgi:hypothetical protein
MPHHVRTILNQKMGRWLMGSSNLARKEDLTQSTDEALNPATFLEGEPPSFLLGRRSLTHECLDITENQMKVRPDLRETPFQTGFHFSLGRSSWVIEGKRHNG